MHKFVGVLNKYVTDMARLWQTLRSLNNNTKPNWLRQKDLNLFGLVQTDIIGMISFLRST